MNETEPEIPTTREASWLTSVAREGGEDGGVGGVEEGEAGVQSRIEKCPKTPSAV